MGQDETRKCANACYATNQYMDSADRVCKNCEGTCTTCSGPLSTNCLTCSGARYFNSGSCLLTCPNGKYGATSDNTCKGCNTNCLTCQTPDAPTYCLSCDIPLYLKSNACVANCASNEYKDDSDRKCKPCEGTCTTCSQGLSTNCLSCTLPLYHSTGSGDGSCVATCSVGRYAHDATKICQTVCPISQMGRDETRKCANSCFSTNQYMDSVDRVCKNCEGTCTTCSGPLSTQCLTCSGVRYLNSGSCLLTCPNGKYGATIDNTCKNCDSNCLTCKTPDAPTFCLSCDIPLYLKNNACVANCDSNEYKDDSDRKCKPCDSTCTTCSEQYTTNCRTCSVNRFHSTGMGSTDGECLLNCPSPRFAHFPTRICQIACPAPTWGRESDRVCYDDCATTGEYKDSADRICKACHTTCETCKGPNVDDCLSCSGSRYLYGNMCLTDCLEGKYGKSSTKTCENCNSLCKTCQTPDGPNTCLSCEVPRYLKSNTCQTSCNSNEYEDDANKQCASCHPSCTTCFNSLSTSCLSCSSSLFFYEVDNSCVSSCSAPYYKYSVTNECRKTCPSPYFGRNTTRSCELTCELANQYADPSDRICRDCNAECLTCNGLSNSDCLTCGGLRYLKSKQCVLACGAGYYGDSSDSTCKLCAAPCVTCTTPDGPAVCTQCGEVSADIYFLSSNSCVCYCPAPLWGRIESYSCESSCLNSHQYGDPSDRVCKECASSCLTCDENGCVTCDAGLFLYQNKCQPNCPRDLGYWPNEITHICDICDSSCKTCIGPADSECTSCLLPYYLLEGCCVLSCPVESVILYKDPSRGTCEKSCLEGFYPDKESLSCIRCHESCKSCSQGTSTSCLSCGGKLVLTPDKGTCTEACPYHYFNPKLASGAPSPNCTGMEILK